MSLRVWLPLNNNTNNYGLTNITVTNNGATINTSGKIGSCYEFNDSKNISLTNYITEFLTYTEWSISLWFKCTAQNTAHTGSALISSGNWNYPTQLLQFSLGYFSTDHYTKLLITNSSGWSNGYTYNFYLNTWYHVVLVSGNNKMSAYVNGELIGNSFSAYTPVSSAQADIGIGKATYYNGMSFFGLMNDVRIYDHALSQQEISEISKGLVLHYQLNDAYNEQTTNLCSQLIQGGQMTVVNNVLTHNGTNSDTYWYIKPKEALIGGATYTVSCYLSGFALDTDWIQWGVGAQSGDNNAGHWKTYNGYNSFTFTMPAGKDGSTANFIFDDSNGGTGRSQVFTISNVQLELKDHATPFIEYGRSRISTIIYDSSGYKNNGIIIGNITIKDDVPKYRVCTSMNNINSANRIESIPDISLPTEGITATIWVKTLKSTNQVIFAFPQLEFGIINSLGFVSLVNDAGFTLNNFIDNEWNFIAVVRQENNYLLYVNGIEETRATTRNYYIHNGNKLYLLNRNYNNNYAGNADIVDFRIYATALSAKDILSLYNNSAYIDENNKIYGKIR